MVSDRDRGAIYERRAKEELEAAGYKVDRARGQIIWIPTPKWHPMYGKVARVPITRDVDWLDAFDLEAVCPTEILYIQVTTGGYSAASRRRDKVAEAAKSFPVSPLIKHQVWRWQTRKGWWVEQYDPVAGEWRTLKKPA